MRHGGTVRSADRVRLSAARKPRRRRLNLDELEHRVSPTSLWLTGPLAHDLWWAGLGALDETDESLWAAYLESTSQAGVMKNLFKQNS